MRPIVWRARCSVRRSSQPLYSLAWNDRRTEHLARQTMVRIEQGRRTTFGLYWANDLRDVLLRYGWPTWWTRDPPMSSLLVTEPTIAGLEPSPAFQFMPGARSFVSIWDMMPDDWSSCPME